MVARTEKGKPVNEKGKKPATKAPPKKRKAPAKKQPRKGEPADAILGLVPDLDPERQFQIHRFALALQASGSRKALSAVLWFTGFLVVAIIVMAFFMASSIKLIALDDRGVLHSVAQKDSSELKYSNSKITNFAADTALEVFDISFINWERRLERVSNKRFTQFGKENIIQAMGNLIADLKKTQGYLSLESIGPASIIGYETDGTGWTTQQKVRVTLKPATGKPITNVRALTFKIKRVDDFDNEKGIAINQTVLGDVRL